MGQQAGTELYFGISFPDAEFGLVQSWEIEESVTRAESIAPDGAVVSIQEHGYMATLNLVYLLTVAGSTDQPAIGTTFEFENKNWQIDNIGDLVTVDGFEAKTVDAHWYPKINDA